MEQMKEDTTLPAVMGKLNIEPFKGTSSLKEDNPFSTTQWKSNLTNKSVKPWKCFCEPHRKKDVTIPIYKKKSKVIKEPTLKFLKNCKCTSMPMADIVRDCVQRKSRTSMLYTEPVNENNLSSLLDCKLKIPSERSSPSISTRNVSKEPLPQKESGDRNRMGPSCSQEVLNPPCDVTIDELASYFETLVHIPKKMSSMAEMMYI